MALLPQCQAAAVSAIPNAKQRGVLMHPPIYKHALAALSIRHVEIRRRGCGTGSRCASELLDDLHAGIGAGQAVLARCRGSRSSPFVCAR